jgi:hypothetical protein
MERSLTDRRQFGFDPRPSPDAFHVTGPSQLIDLASYNMVRLSAVPRRAWASARTGSAGILTTRPTVGLNPSRLRLKKLD